MCTSLTALSIPKTYAQEEDIIKIEGMPPPPESVENEQPEIPKTPTKPAKNKSYPSLFFTFWQHQSIKEMKESRGFVKAPTEQELNSEDEFTPNRGIREIKLGGIAFKTEKDWTIWLNNQRVKPDSIPEEILDLVVYKDYIELKWLDAFTNTIYPIKLKTNQRFNLDQRIFLMGE